MSDEDKTRAQLVERLAELRRQVAVGEKEKTEYQRAEGAVAREYGIREAESAVRVAIASMDVPEDLFSVVSGISEQLETLGLDHDGCSVQILDENATGFHSVGTRMPEYWDKVLDALSGNPDGMAMANVTTYPWVPEVWRSGEAKYQPCVSFDTKDSTLSTLSVIDVPFLRGTLSINRRQPNAFTQQDVAVMVRLGRVLSEGFQRFLDIADRKQAERLRETVSRVRGQVWRVEEEGGLENVLTVVGDSLREAGVTFRDCGINLVEGAGEAPQVRFYDAVLHTWVEAGPERGAGVILRIWREGSVAYRKDLSREDAYGEAAQIERTLGHPARSVVDVPFSGGTLAVSSDQPEAFSVNDLALLKGVAEVLSEGLQRVRDVSELRQERDRAQSYLDVAQVILVALDGQGKISLINRGGRELLGYEEGELLGADWFDLTISPDERDEVRFVYAQLMAGQVDPVEHHDNSIVTSAGDRRLVAWHNALLRDSEGNVTGTLSSGEDITERRRAEEELQEQREWLEVTLASIGDAVIATDCSGAIVFMNPVAEALTGWSAQEARATGLDEVFHTVNEQTQEPAENPVRRALEEGTIVGLANHTALVSRDGSVIPIADSGAPIRGPDGSVQGVVMVFRDVTDEKQREEDARRIHSLESLGVLAGGIAHDFNNILTGVTGNLALLTRLLDKGSDAHEIAADARLAADRTKGLTRQLMTFAQGGAPVKETASVESLLKETTELTLHGSNVKPQHNVAEGLPLVEVDVGQIGQVMQNLVLNADQAMPQGGVLKVSAEVAAVPDCDPLPLEAGAYVKVSVEDEGIGMSEEVLSKVFDPYYTTKPAGHGLGLSIVHSIIRKHDGFVGATSEPGVGTTFEFYLPASEKDILAESEAEEEPERGTGRVLLMDDEEMIHKTVGRMLKALGYDVESVGDGAEALRAYQAALDQGNPFHAVIMDLTIPGGMGGQEAVARLHELDPQARVIVSSGYSNDPVMARFEEYGFAARMAKPINLEGLASLMSGVLSEGTAPEDSKPGADEK